MKIINDGLPGPIYDLISADPYSRGDADISVTQLIDSPRVRVLYKQHDSELECSASSLLAVTLGRALHSAIEGATKNGTAERRLSITVNGWKLSGCIDHYDSGLISDYKTTTVWKTVSAPRGRLHDFENQLNVYAQIMRENGYPVTELKIFALFKDWNNRGYSEALRKCTLWKPNESGGYPQKEWAYFNLKLWSEETAKEYILNRIKAHQEAEKKLPRCEPHEVWDGKRCKKYCLANKFCLQYTEAQKTGLIKGAKDGNTEANNKGK